MYRRKQLAELVESSSCFLLERLERNLKHYPFIDTKFNIRSGEDFRDTDEYFRRRDHIYGWIQGRGLESLAGHAAYFERQGKTELASRFDQVLQHLVPSLESLRLKMNGRLSFAFSEQGVQHFDTSTKYANYTDIFYTKGLFAAASRLGLKSAVEYASFRLKEIGRDIFERRFSSDQYMFDPANRGGGKPGKYSQGPLMIFLGATALTKEFGTARQFISFIIEHHINHGQFANLPAGCFVEALDENNNPWLEDDGKIICDPGHALEFTGLAARNLIQMSRVSEYSGFVSSSAETIATLFCRVFDCGFQTSGGIMKAYDLTEELPVNTDAPWWSLPESLRAAALLAELYPPAEEELQKRAALMTDAFFNNYIANGKYGFACQMCDVNGDPADVIPAVPDADPLYHTNLPLIDIFELQKS